MTSAATPAPRLFDVKLPSAPYPGLRPFERHEWPVFFGRETMTGEAVRRLLDQNLLVVHGDSGCGKSSLIRAGVLVQLEQRHARGAQRWRTCMTLPREAPLRRLAQTLAGLKEAEPPPDLVRQIRRTLNAGRGAAAKLEDLLCHDPADRVCILVDQFEELFRFAKETNVDEARLFVDILVGLLEEAERRKSEKDRLRLYAVLTMRSEFLGLCARFPGLAEAVNRTQYLLPQMERPGLLRAIREPAALYDGEVDRELADRLITDAGGGQDQLPLIQHGLMLLWQRKVAATTGLAEAAEPWRHEKVLEDAAKPFRHERGPQEPVPRRIHESDEALPPTYRHDNGPVWRLGLEDYQGVGGLADLLSDHADEVMAAAARDDRRKEIVEDLFRALTDIDAEGSAVRRPQTFGQLQAVTSADETTLQDIIDHFRAEGTSFLSPYGDEPIHQGTLIEISHEALIRQWQKIARLGSGWLETERRDGLEWKSLLLQAERKGGLTATEIKQHRKWLERHNEKWAERYGGGWRKVEELIDRNQNILRIQWGVTAAFMLVVISLTSVASWQIWEQRERRAQLEEEVEDKDSKINELNSRIDELTSQIQELELAQASKGPTPSEPQRPIPTVSWVSSWRQWLPKAAIVAALSLCVFLIVHWARSPRGHIGGSKDKVVRGLTRRRSMDLRLPVPAAAALAAKFFPSLIGKLGGDRAEEVAEKVVRAAASAAGVPESTDPEEITAKLKEDPQAEAAARLELAKLDYQEHERMLDDRQQAREREARFQERDKTNWRADIMLGVAVVGLTLCIVLVVTPRMLGAEGGLDTAEIVLVTTVAGVLLKMVSDAFAFEFGSSKGSRSKDRQIRDMQRALIKVAEERHALVREGTPRPSGHDELAVRPG